MNAVKDMALVEQQPEPQALTAQDRLALTVQKLAENPQVDVEKLERIMALQERMVAEAARQEFNIAMAEAQQQMRPVAANAHNPSTRSMYASYDRLDRALRPIYTEHGIGLSFGTDDSPVADHVRIVCEVTHRSGHSKVYRIDMPSDGKGARGGDVMTKTHAVGSAVSYGMRYLLKMIFNVAVGEDDDDGNRAAGRGAPPPPTGLDDWWTDMVSTADEGTKALEAAWKASKAQYRKYVVAHSKPEWEALKAKAAKAGQSS